MESGPLQIRLLGELRVIDGNGHAAELPASKKTRALLGYLVATGRPHLRQRLCELFWDDGPDDPRAALRWSLTKLRPLLNEANAVRLVCDRNHVGFEACGAELDILTIRQLLGSDVAAAPLSALKTAAALGGGEFLDGLDLPTCYRYQAWCLAEREAFSALRLSALSTLIGRERPVEALTYARMLIAADPLSTPGHCAVIRALDSLGRQQDALEHYEQAIRVIEKDLAAPADKELHEAAQALRRVPARRSHVDSPARVMAPLDTSASDAKQAAAFIGRFAESALLDRLAADLGQRRSGPVLHVAGEPGIGKSHLLDQLRGRMASIGACTICARAFEAEIARPYGIWSDIFATLAHEQNATVTLDFHNALSPVAEPPVGRAQFFDSILQALRRLAADRPVLIVLDDAQWLDEGSTAMFHYIARTCQPSNAIMLACATRSGELDDNATVLNVLASLRKEGKLLDVSLAPLTRAETAELIRAVDSTLDPAYAFALSDGNPLFILELARAPGGEASDAQRTLHAVIGRELARLNPDARELLTWAAALGRSFDVEILAALAARPQSELLTALHELERRNVLHPATQGAYDFVHDVVRQVAYHSTSQPRRKLLHARIARHLGSIAEVDDNLASAVAHHAALCSQHLLAARACVLAGERCLRLFANADARSFAERGLWHLDQCPVGRDAADHRIALHKVQVFAAAGPAMRPLPSVANEVTRAIAVAEALGSHEAVMTGHYLLSIIHQEAGRSELARQSTLHAVRVGRSAENAAYIQQLANTARCLLELETEIPRARALLHEAETLAQPLGLDYCEVHWGRGLMQRWDGDADLAEQLVSRALDLARRAADRWREYKCLTWLAIIELERGRAVAARARCTEMLQVARKLGDAEVPLAVTLDALAQLAGGKELDDCELDTDLQQLRAIDDKSHLAYALNAAAMLCIGVNRVETARSYASEALHVAEIMQRTNDQVIAHSTLMRVKWAHADAGPQAADADDRLRLAAFATGDLSRRARLALLEAMQAGGGSPP